MLHAHLHLCIVQPIGELEALVKLGVGGVEVLLAALQGLRALLCLRAMLRGQQMGRQRWLLDLCLSVLPDSPLGDRSL